MHSLTLLATIKATRKIRALPKRLEEYRFENAAVYIDGDLALTTGNVFLVNDKGQETVVDKSWAFKKDEQGQLRIVLHHSSLPYQAK